LIIHGAIPFALEIGIAQKLFTTFKELIPPKKLEASNNAWRGAACVRCQDIGNTNGQDIGYTLAKTWVTVMAKTWVTPRLGRF
jgi:hypothetical protein